MSERGDHPAGETSLAQVAIQPISAGARLVDKEELFSFALEFADEFVDVALAGADRSERDDFAAWLRANVGDRDGLLVDIQTDEKCVRVLHG